MADRSALVGRRKAVRSGRRGSTRTARILAAAGTALIVAAWSTPLLWALFGSFRSQSEMLTGAGGNLLPERWTIANWRLLVDPQGRAVNIFVALANSTVVAVATTAAVLVVSSMAAYALATMRFHGRRLLAVVLLSFLMIPNEVLLVPLFEQFRQWRLLDTYAALILPHVVSVFGVLLLRQFMVNLPEHLVEAGQVDGANAWQIFWRLVLPQLGPALRTVAVFTFLVSWNDFLWPLIAVNSPEMQTLPLALVTFRNGYGTTDYGVVLAGVVLAVVPPIVFYLLAYRRIAEGIGGLGVRL